MIVGRRDLVDPVVLREEASVSAEPVWTRLTVTLLHVNVDGTVVEEHEEEYHQLDIVLLNTSLQRKHVNEGSLSHTSSE